MATKKNKRQPEKDRKVKKETIKDLDVKKEDADKVKGGALLPKGKPIFTP